MRFLRQTVAIFKNDLRIVAQRHWFSTLVRALIFPIVFTVIIAEISNWISSTQVYGTGVPSPIRPLSDTLSSTGKTRPNVVIINHGITDGDNGRVVDSLSDTVRSSGKQLHIIDSARDLPAICPSSNKGVSPCFGAVDLLSSPSQPPGALWNYTTYSDSALGGSIDVSRTDNDVQVYIFPFQQAINSAIAATNSSVHLPNTVQYPFTTSTEQQRLVSERKVYFLYVVNFLAFAFIIGLAGNVFHLVGYITQQRESGMLQLIDAMMPKSSRWEAQASRILSNYASFTLIYLPGWIIMGVSLSRIAFPNTGTGIFVLLFILTGLALTSFAILASALFKTTQLSAISTIITCIVLAVAAQFGEPPHSITASTAGVIATGLLFPPMTMTYALMLISGFELDGHPFNFQGNPRYGSTTTAGGSHWRVPGAALFGFFAFQIIVYPFIGAVIERLLHGTSSHSRNTKSNAQDLGGNAVRLSNFSKHFKSKTRSKKGMVKAVDNLSFDLVEGSITVLLGANGSGKSTTLNAIAGIETVTEGSIDLDGTGGLGLCPQRNVLFDELTVREHIAFFERLKSTETQSKSYHESEVERLISACDLSFKATAKAKTLSGGQKRKLQMAMMLAGGSKVCCIDEASSGIDPLARQKLWNILLAERGSRSILFTTHFLDEAEVLSDHIAILSKGTLRAQGSAAELKNTLGNGYRVTLHDRSRAADVAPLPGVSRRNDYDLSIFEIQDASTLSTLVAELERQRIQGYRIQGPTIEDVFLKLAEELQDESDLNPNMDIASEKTQLPLGSTSSQDSYKYGQHLELHTGQESSALRQTWVLFLKRVIILKHNFMPYVGAMFIALVAAGLVTRFLIDFRHPNGVSCTENSQSSSSPITGFTLQPYNFYLKSFVYGPRSALGPADLDRAIPNTTSSSVYRLPTYARGYEGTPSVDSLSDFDKYLAANRTSLYIGGIYDDPSQFTLAWSASSKSASYPAILAAAGNNIATAQKIGYSHKSFAVQYLPQNGPTTLIAVFTALGFAIYPGLFAIYPTGERLRNVRAMQYSNGIKSSSIWVAYALFDLTFVILISVLATAIWASQWTGWYALGYMFVVFFLYGLAATAFSYVVSLFAKSQIAAIAMTSVLQVVIAMLYFVGCFLATTYAPANELSAWMSYLYYTIGLICPGVSLLRALYMCLSMWSLVCRGNEKASYPGEISIYGGPILYLVVQFLLLSAFLMYWESGKSLEVFGIRRRTKQTDSEANLRGQEADAAEDPFRLSPDNDGLRVLNTSKAFGSNVAVENVSFGAQRSERFALLGPNGAGKSTVISLIRGDLKQTGSDGAIFIGGDSLQQAPVAARSHLGVCPQFDAQDAMTVVETLRFYARARNVPDMEHNIREIIGRLGLNPHANKLTRKLSGGTKRKLSLAIALIANPRVLLLDEPSSGMDPAAKRALWRTLSAIAPGRVLLLTTHSMEEADALCDRAGIMASRLLALGTTDELRRRHGGALHIHLVHRDAPYTSASDIANMREWAETTFPGAHVEDRTYHGQIRFSIPQQGLEGDRETGRAMGIVEQAKASLGVEHYSIGPATLDQVFLNVVTKHDVEEENSGKHEEKAGGLRRRLFRRSE